MSEKITNRLTGETVTFLETTEQTRGQYLLLEVELPPHTVGPAMQRHDLQERDFQIVSGTLSVTTGKPRKTFDLIANDRYGIPKKTFYMYANEQDEPVKFLVRIAPAKDVEQVMRIHFGLINAGLTNEQGIPLSTAHQAYIFSLQNTWLADKPLLPQKLQSIPFSKPKKKAGLSVSLVGYSAKSI